MLYIVLLENLLAELDYEKKQKLISLVFKKTSRLCLLQTYQRYVFVQSGECRRLSPHTFGLFQGC